MEKNDTETRGRVVLATVKGDVHDIGKNLVDIILSNNGYEVHNLGIKVSVEEMIEKAKEINADAIGMSGLLVKSTNIMRDNIDEIKRQGLNKKILLGGAALTEKFVTNDCMPIMPGMVNYCRDAFDALKVLAGESEVASAPETTYADRSAKPREVRKPVLEEPPALPFTGTKLVENINVDDILEYMNKLALFSHRWGYSKKSMPDYEYNELIEKTVIPEFNEAVAEAKEKGILELGIKYGYYYCNSDGQDLVIYKGETDEELSRFAFPRQNIENGISLTDYFHPVSSGVKDVVAFHIVTVGNKAAEFCQQLFKNDEYKKYYQFHGFFTELAEAMAEYAHKMVRAQLGIDGKDSKTAHGIISLGYAGRRYSFGYPSCPDLAQNTQLDSFFDFSEIGVSITENHEMVSEYTTCAIVVHNSTAEYFTV